MAWLTDHVPHALRHLGISDDPDGWTVGGSFVTDTQVMAPHVKQCRLRVWAWTELRDAPWP